MIVKTMPDHHEMDICEKLAIAEKLLGRMPKVAYKIASRCGDATPQVLQTNPVYFEDNRWKPFPTYFWLVCPRLRYEIAKLEAQGAISMFSRRLASEIAFRNQFLNGQELLRQERIKLAEIITENTLPDYVRQTLLATNIAGSKNPMGVKCLHAHTAQALVFGSNPIGDEVLAQVGRCDKDKRCRKVISSGKVKI